MTEVARIILRVGKVSDDLQGDWSKVARLHPDGVRRIVHRITAEPIAALYIMRHLDTDTVPLPSGGSTVCLLRLGILSAWEPQYFADGFKAVRAEARTVLEHMPPEYFLAAEWWGVWGCNIEDESLGIYGFGTTGSACSGCPAMNSCVGLNSGVV